MKKKQKLDDVDVVFQSTSLTREEKKLISEYIRQDKSKRTKKSSSNKARRQIAA